MAATVTEIARHAGVSIGLVSRVLNGDDTVRISPQRREEIISIRDQLGGVKLRKGRRTNAYHIVAPVARQFSMQWVGANLSNSAIITGLENVLKARKFRFSFSFFDADKKMDAFRDLIGAPDFCDGVLLLSKVVDADLAELLLNKNYPHISVDFRAEKFGVNTIDAHQMSGYRQGIAHLAGLGHKKIGFVGPRDANHYALFLAGMVEEGFQIDEKLNCFFDIGEVSCWQSEEWCVRANAAFGEYLDAGGNASAVICQNDMTAMGVLRAMERRSLIPSVDISVIGFDNIEQRGDSPVENPILTTIDSPLGEIGKRCGELLLNQIVHKQAKVVHEYVPVELIERKTTGKYVAK